MASTGYCTNYTATGTGNWSNPGTWGGAGFPQAGDAATISSAVTVTVDVASACTNLTISAGTVTQNASLTVSGIYSQTGGTFTASSPSTVTFSANDFRIPTTSGTLYFNRFTGTGTAGNPYVIYDVYGLQAVEEKLNNQNYILANNIDASGTVNWNAGSGSAFAPIGTSFANYFQGTFNGEGYTISHLSITRPGTSYIGLFGYVEGGTITNLNLTVDNITGASYIGGLVGAISNILGSISYCTVTVNSSKTISGASYVGGLIGQNLTSTVSNTYVTISGTVSGTGTYIGGFIGENVNSNSTISNSYVTGTVGGTGSDVGGFVGWNSSSPISNSFATVSVSGSSTVNGFVGLDASGTYNNDWYYNGNGYIQPTGITEASGYSDFYGTGSGTGGAVYLTSGTCYAWNFPGTWTSQTSNYPILTLFTSWDIWQGPSGGSWSNAANWSSGLPTSTTNVLFNSSDNNASTIDSGFAGTVNNLTINGYTGTITQSANLTINGAYTQNSGTFTCTTPATYSFTASTGFSIPTTSGTL